MSFYTGLHLWSNIFIAVGFIVAALAGFGSFYSGKKIEQFKEKQAEIREKDLQGNFDSLQEGNETLQQRLAPFEEFAQKIYPDDKADEALGKLSKDVEKMRTELQAEKNTIRDFETKLEITFSGKWSSSPVIRIMSPVNNQYYVELIKTENPEDRPIKFFATEAYSFDTLSSSRVVFKARQAVHKGDYPVGKGVETVFLYDAINVHMPIVATEKIEGKQVLVERIEIIFYINGKERDKLLYARPKEIPLDKGWINSQLILTDGYFAARLKAQ